MLFLSQLQITSQHLIISDWWHGNCNLCFSYGKNMYNLLFLMEEFLTFKNLPVAMIRDGTCIFHWFYGQSTIIPILENSTTEWKKKWNCFFVFEAVSMAKHTWIGWTQKYNICNYKSTFLLGEKIQDKNKFKMLSNLKILLWIKMLSNLYEMSKTS